MTVSKKRLCPCVRYESSLRETLHQTLRRTGVRDDFGCERAPRFAHKLCVTCLPACLPARLPACLLACPHLCLQRRVTDTNYWNDLFWLARELAQTLREACAASVSHSDVIRLHGTLRKACANLAPPAF